MEFNSRGVWWSNQRVACPCSTTYGMNDPFHEHIFSSPVLYSVRLLERYCYIKLRQVSNTAIFVKRLTYPADWFHDFQFPKFNQQPGKIFDRLEISSLQNISLNDNPNNCFCCFIYMQHISVFCANTITSSTCPPIFGNRTVFTYNESIPSEGTLPTIKWEMRHFSG